MQAGGRQAGATTGVAEGSGHSGRRDGASMKGEGPLLLDTLTPTRSTGGGGGGDRGSGTNSRKEVLLSIVATLARVPC